MSGPFDDLAGELEPGDTGWLPLDLSGNPIGPATILPPPPPALACAVRVNPTVPLPEGEHYLTSSTGAELHAPLTSNVEKRSSDWQPPVEVAPAIISLTPSTAVRGTDDFEMAVNGTGFKTDTVIVFNGGDELTDYISDTEVRTGVKPSLVSAAVTVPVCVRNGATLSNTMNFSFTDPDTPAGRRTSRK